MEGVSLPLHARLRTAAVPELSHRQIVCPASEVAMVNLEGRYMAGAAVRV